MIVEYVFQREELRNGLAVDRHQNIAGRQDSIGAGSGLHVVHHQHAGQPGIRLAHARFGVGLEPEPLEFIVGRVLEHRFQRAARHGLADLDVLECAHHRGQRQVETRGGAGGAARIERHHPALDVDHRRTGGTARGAGGRLIVKRIEIVVLAVAVLRRFAIEARQRAGQDRQLFARIVADDADFTADHRALRIQRQLGRLNETQFCRIVAIDAEVMNRIAIDRIELHFLPVQEDGLRGHGSGRDDMTIGQYQSALGIDDEAGGLRGRIPLGIECARAVDLNGDHAGRNSFQGLRPIGRRTGDAGALASAGKQPGIAGRQVLG